MEPEAVLDLFRKSGALLEGHFRLTSGLHSERYLQSALVLQYPEFAGALGDALANRVKHLQPTVVLSPALGEHRPNTQRAADFLSDDDAAERQDGKLTLRRGFMLSPSDRVVVVEDVVTTGGSTRETIDVATALGAAVVAAASLIDRGGDPVRVPVPLPCRCQPT
jgi:orotate phosphoribosyltransferase